jgi:SH3-like domain-containing protein
MRRAALLAALMLGLAGASAHALEFRSVKDTGVVLYDAPATAAKKLFVVSRYYPVEVLSQHKDWARVRDATGGIAWMQGSALSSQRWLLVTTEQARVRRSAGASAAMSFSVPKDGVLELMAPPKAGWVKVRHPDGAQGYARIDELWGL